MTVPLAENMRNVVSTGNFDRNSLDNYKLGYDLITKNPSFVNFENKKSFFSNLIRIHNRLECNYNLADKKFLYLNMKKYYQAIGENVFDYLPLTFHLENGEDDSSFSEFSSVFES